MPCLRVSRCLLQKPKRLAARLSGRVDSLERQLRKARSNEAFYKVDYDLVVQLAEIAASNGVKKFIVVSSIGANASSSNFYLRTKGEMENAIQKLPFEAIRIVRPSILTGKRKEFR